MEDASMDKFTFLFFTGAAIVAPFSRTAPGGSILGLLRSFFGEESHLNGLLIEPGRPLHIRPEYILSRVSRQQHFFGDFSTSKSVQTAGYRGEYLSGQ